MKRFSKILLSLIVLLGFATSVDAASYPNSISASKSSTKYEYVSGLPVYYNRASSYNLYILDANTYFSSSTTLTDPVEANGGFAYIVNNSNVTGDTYKNYYIAQVAVLWYQDYLSGSDANIPASIKSQITSNTGNTVCYYINKLVNNAKTYGQAGGSIKFLDKDVTFSRSGSYYYSNIIDVETNDLKSTPSIKLSSAPSSASIVNNSVTRDGRGSFQIRVPATSLSSYKNYDFEVYISGTGYDNTVYRYTNYGMSDVIYGRSYTGTSSTVDAILPVSLKEVTSNTLKIRVLDKNGDYISGLSYSIYSGNCAISTCSSSNLLDTFKTINGYSEINNLYGTGTYTIVRKSSTKYDLPEKKVINTNNLSNNDTITIQEDNDNVDFGTDYEDETNNNRYFVIRNDINDKNDNIKIYTTSGKLITSYKSSDTSYNAYLDAGNYYLVDSEGKLDILYFRVTDDGVLYVKYGDSYIRVNSIDISKDNDYQEIIDKELENNNGEYSEEYTDDVISLDDIEVSQDVDVDVKVDWLSNIIDVPITDLSSTLKYIVGFVVLGSGIYLVYRNVKKSKNNI